MVQNLPAVPMARRVARALPLGATRRKLETSHARWLSKAVFYAGIATGEITAAEQSTRMSIFDVRDVAVSALGRRGSPEGLGEPERRG